MFGSKDSTTRLEDEEKVPEQRHSEEDADYVASTDHDADGSADEEADADSEGNRPAVEVNRANGTVYNATPRYPDDEAEHDEAEHDEAEHDEAEHDEFDEAHDSVGIAPAPTDASEPAPVAVEPAPIAVAPVDAVALDETVEPVDETEPEHEEQHEDLKPGAVEPQPVTAFWNDADAQAVKVRWRELQLRFIDDPRSVADDAQVLVEEAVATITARLSEAKDGLDTWRDGQGDETERLRSAVRGYRDFLDRVLGL